MNLIHAGYSLSPTTLEVKVIDAKKDKNNEEKIREMRDKEYKKRLKRERDIKRESSEGFEKKIAGE